MKNISHRNVLINYSAAKGLFLKYSYTDRRLPCKKNIIVGFFLFLLEPLAKYVFIFKKQSVYTVLKMLLLFKSQSPVNMIVWNFHSC